MLLLYSFSHDIYVVIVGEEGGNINLFIQQNQGKYSQQEIQSMLEAMSGEGNVYSTTDEFHYAAVNE